MDNREKKTVLKEKDIKTIIEKLESVQFGSVSVVIQNGKIVQIEKIEKEKFT
jgi:hypothetical protein